MSARMMQGALWELLLGFGDINRPTWACVATFEGTLDDAEWYALRCRELDFEAVDYMVVPAETVERRAGYV